MLLYNVSDVFAIPLYRKDLYMIKKSNYVAINNELFLIDMMYAHQNNMLCCPIYDYIGWGNLAVVHEDLWACLENLIPMLEKNHMKLKVCDAYRHPYAHDLMKKTVTLDGFFAKNAEKSQHCRATAVDVCLCDENGNELLFPTKVDAYDAKYAKEIAAGNSENFKKHLVKARHDYMQAEPVAIRNREFLRSLMEFVGLQSIPHEWWHYNLPNGNTDLYPVVELNPSDFK